MFRQVCPDENQSCLGRFDQTSAGQCLTSLLFPSVIKVSYWAGLQFFDVTGVSNPGRYTVCHNPSLMPFPVRCGRML